MLLFACHYGNSCAPPVERCVLDHPVVMSCLIWAVTVVILAVLVFCYKRNKARIMKEMAEEERDYELKMKKVAFEREQKWYNIQKEENNNEETKKLKEEIEELKNGEKIKKNEKELKQKDTEIDLLNKQLDLYKKAINNMHVEFQIK